MINTDEMKARIESNIQGSQAEVHDMDGAGRHYEVVVVADAFEGKALIDRHRMVYSALGGVVGSELMHAAKISAKTPQESKGE